MSDRSFLLALAMIPWCTVQAQISLVATMPVRATSLSSLVNAGPKLLSYSASGFELYEPNGTPFLSVSYPPLPPDMSFAAISPVYVTEELFDQDPTTIEYLHSYQTITGGGTMIARTDGTILLLDTAYTIAGPYGFDAFSTFPPIFNTPTGTVLVLVRMNDSRIYSLPGELPCLDCSFNNATGGGAELAPPTAGLAVFPTLSGTSVVIDHAALMHRSPTRLLVMDAAGRVVDTLAPAPAGRMSYDVSSLAAGTYTYVLEGREGRLASTRQVVVR